VKSPILRARRLRRALTWAGLLLCLVLLYLESPLLMSPERLQVDDYVEYWAAGRLNLSGANPYSPEALVPLENQAGRFFQVPVMMWNPPYTLAIAMPLAWLPYPVSRLVWLILNVALLTLGAEWTWRVYGGPPRYRWLAWLLCLVFFSSLNALGSGQIAILLFAGVAGFLYYQREGKPWQAGMLAALTVVKPHLLYLFWIALILWSWRRRRWTELVAATGVVLAGTAVAMAFNPSVVGQYIQGALHDAPIWWHTPTLGGALRGLLGPEKSWLQFAPMLLGTGWLLARWRGSRGNWCWPDEMPLLLVVSVITAAYGWTFDQVVLLVMILSSVHLLSESSARIPAIALMVAGIAINFVALGLRRAFTDAGFWWLAPSWLVWYMAVRKWGSVTIPMPVTESGPELPL
jgi:hypothetical protein